jgi:hypothetical protein
MPALSSFVFEGLRLRPAIDGDYPLAQSWADVDPYHRGSNAAFWVDQNPGIESYLLSDRWGPLFFFRLDRIAKDAATVHIQFAPGNGADHKIRIIRGMTCGLRWIERVLLSAGINALYFDSKNPQLIAFCTRRLGFEKLTDSRLRKVILDVRTDARAAGNSAGPD